MSGYLVAAAAAVVAAVALLGSSWVAERFAVDAMLARGVSHFLVGTTVSVAVLFVTDPWPLVAVVAVVLPGTIAAIELGWLGPMLVGRRSRDYGFAAYLVGLVAVGCLFLPHQEPVITGIMSLAIADPVAAYVGRRFGTHPIVAGWGATRTLEGSAACAACIALIAAIGLVAAGASAPVVVAGAALIGLIGAIVELLCPSFLDNLLIQVWVGWLTYEAAVHPLDTAETWRWLAAAVVGAGGAVAIVRLGWLTAAGSALVVLVGATAFAIGGGIWLLPGVAFFATTSLLPLKTRSEHASEPRQLSQAVVNCLIPTLPLVGYVAVGGRAWVFLYVGAIAAACGDSWASEIGRMSQAVPRSLRGWRPVRPGESGGLTVLGTLGSLAGGLLVGVVAVALAHGDVALALVVVGVACGVLGSGIDSVLGAFAEARWRCGRCGELFEGRSCCGEPSAELAQGLAWVDNDVVNASANVAGAAIALAVYAAFFAL